jgi:ABC-type molybdenum transport system ATPase subunit/photorepair protein PhrA
VTYNILLGREITKSSSPGIIDWQRMIGWREWLAGFDLPPGLANEQVRNLSDEQRQVLMPRALHRPCLLLLDDLPALSFQRQEILLATIGNWRRREAVIIISDD